MPTLSETVAGALVHAGSRAIFGVPGGGCALDLIDAARRVDLPFVLTATETGAALAAMAQAEVTGRPGVCLTTLGPGASSAVNGVACAWLDRAPLVVLTDIQTGDPASPFEHQRLDHQALFRPITKWSALLSPATAERTLACVLRTAMDAPPGPVHLDVAEQQRTGHARSADPPLAATTADPRDASQPPARFSELISRARRPLIIVGLGARRDRDAAAVRHLTGTHGIPVMVTYKAKGVVPDEHPCFAGVFTNAKLEQAIVEQSDLILGVGLDPVELLPRRWPFQQPIVNVNRWAVADTHVPFAAQWIAGADEALDVVRHELPPTSWDLAGVQSLVRQQRRDVAGSSTDFAPQRVVQLAAERLPAHARVTVDAGAHMLPATLLWPVHEPNQLLISNGLSTMGFALPAAIGAALADRDRHVVALTGDGGLLMCAGELLTAVRERVRLVVIVFADESLTLIEVKQRQKRYPPAGVALGKTRWDAVADGFGLAAFAASSARELGRALDQALAVDGPSLIDVRVDPSSYDGLLQIVRG